jgi:glycosyltransferase involved in cell wall biosynthesis
VTASLNEGFGLPLVEAMAGGTPIAVSDIPIFREIGGDAAVFFDPQSPESFASSIRSLENSTEWNRRSGLARHRATHYSWDESAKALLGTLTAVYKSRGGASTGSVPGAG